VTRRRTDRTADRLAKRLEHAADIIPTIRAHLNEQRGHVSAIRAAGNDTSRSRDTNDPTGRLVLELDRIDYREGLIDDALASIRVGINLLDEACRDALGHRAPGTPGAASSEPICWEAGCTDIVESKQRNYGVWYHPTGLCPRHRKAQERHEREMA
jgi:hypothetical protein